MKLSHNWLQCYFEKPLPTPEKLAEFFTFGAFEVEGIEKILDAQGKQIDTVIDVKVLPDRAHYALSHRGVASEVAALVPMSRKPITKPPFTETSTRKVEVKNLEPKLCTRYVARYVENVTVGKTPDWPRLWLEAIGQRSINTVVDATNTVMFDLGQPLHAFDADKVKGGITVRLAKGGEKITTLDSSAGAGKEIELTPEMLVIADDVGVLAVAGVKGGSRAAVTNDTKNLILESACFDPVSVRKTSTKIGIRNESSKRFENEITPHLAGEAMHWLTALILELSPKDAGGKVQAKAGPVTDVYTTLPEVVKISVTSNQINTMLGVSIAVTTMAELLKRLEIGVEISGETLNLSIPHERLDLRIPADIAEEVGRLYGYDKIPVVLPKKISSVIVNPVFYYSEKIKNILIEQGFSEVYSYALVPKGDYEVAKPLASDKGALRISLVEGLSKALEMNVRNADLLGLDTVKIFKIGTVFGKEKESTSLCLACQQVKKVKGVTSATFLQTAIDAVGKSLGVSLDAKIITKEKMAICEIDFTTLVATLPVPASYDDLKFIPAVQMKYKPFSQYPFIVRDIAMFVPVDDMVKVKAVLLQGIAQAGAEKLVVKGPDCFDQFEKDGRVSLAFRMIFQSFENTLSDEQVNSYMKTVTEMVMKQGWVVR